MRRVYSACLIWSLFIGFVLCFIALMLLTDRKVSYYEIPIRYERRIKSKMGLWAGGVDTSVKFRSDAYPNVRFFKFYVGGQSAVRSRALYRALAESKPAYICCYIDPAALEKGGNVSFIYTDHGVKDYNYWQDIYCDVKWGYSLLWLVFISFLIYVCNRYVREHIYSTCFIACILLLFVFCI